MILARALALPILLVSTGVAVAGPPAGAFTAGVQAHGAGGIVFGCQSEYRGGEATLPASSVANPARGCPKPCGTVECTASGTASKILARPQFVKSSGSRGDFTVSSGNTMTVPAGYSTDYRNVSVGANGTLNMPREANVRITTLSLGPNSRVNFFPGDYWIETLQGMGSGSGPRAFTVAGNGTVRIQVLNAVNLDFPVEWNDWSRQYLKTP